MSNIEKLITDSKFAYKEIVDDASDRAETRWLNKEVENFKVIHDCNSLDKIELVGFGSLKLTESFGHKNEKSICLETNTDIEDKRPRPSSTLVMKFDEEDWTNYNRISLWVYPESKGFQNFYFHFSLQNTGDRGLLHAPSLTPNKWNHIVWEIPHVNRDKITRLSMGPLLMGCPPEAEPEIKVYFDDIQLQKVDPDYVEGWNLDDRIGYCHSGYFHNAKKIAVTQVAKNDTFNLLDENDKVVFEGNVNKVTSDLGEYYELDFSDHKKEGAFYLQIDDRKTQIFTISALPYLSSIWKSINFLRMLRCGYDVPEVHSPCHLTHHTVHPDGRVLPDHGGWHDAGDVSQFEICTAEMAHAILDLAEKVIDKDKVLGERLLDEARWGMNWLLRTRFGDGYRSMSVLYSTWRKNVYSYEDLTIDGAKTNKAENGAFENFLASAAEATGARLFKEYDDVFASWCLRAAKEDFDFAVDGYENDIYTKRWGPLPDPQLCGAAVLAACELFTVTEDAKYIDYAAKFAKKILASQQRTYPDWKIPLRGFFYEDETHSKLLTYEHRGHEQSPIHGLIRLCEVASNHKDKALWDEGIELYAEYILKTSNMVSPFNLLPAHVYEHSKLNMIRFTIPPSWATEAEAKESFKRQIENGIKLDKDVYLRRFPIAIQRRGYHATLLSKTKAVSAMAKYLNNDELKQVAINQIEWILGKNPFNLVNSYLF